MTRFEWIRTNRSGELEGLRNSVLLLQRKIRRHRGILSEAICDRHRSEESSATIKLKAMVYQCDCTFKYIHHSSSASLQLKNTQFIFSNLPSSFSLKQHFWCSLIYCYSLYHHHHHQALHRKVDSILFAMRLYIRPHAFSLINKFTLTTTIIIINTFCNLIMARSFAVCIFRYY